MLGLNSNNINLRAPDDGKSTGVLVTPGIIEAEDWEKNK